jgi:hypothetical protein
VARISPACPEQAALLEAFSFWKRSIRAAVGMVLPNFSGLKIGLLPRKADHTAYSGSELTSSSIRSSRAAVLMES